MGYTTSFDGRFDLNKPLDRDTLVYLKNFSETRRMARRLPPKYGAEGEFYVNGERGSGDHDDNVIDYNTPPSTQPGLWCNWTPNEEGTAIEWNGAEKFYNYTEWLQYLITNFLAPKGYVLDGAVEWEGEDSNDFGLIVVEKNSINIKIGKKVYIDQYNDL